MYVCMCMYVVLMYVYMYVCMFVPVFTQFSFSTAKYFTRVYVKTFSSHFIKFGLCITDSSSKVI